MPFLRVDAYEGRSKKQVKELLDAIHRAILSAFGVPLRDRYQVYQEHSESNFIVQDTGLGIDRTKNAVFIGITSRQRPEAQKTTPYTKLVEELKTCRIEQKFRAATGGGLIKSELTPLTALADSLQVGG